MDIKKIWKIGLTIMTVFICKQQLFSYPLGFKQSEQRCTDRSSSWSSEVDVQEEWENK